MRAPVPSCTIPEREIAGAARRNGLARFKRSRKTAVQGNFFNE
jgi:hypothetical protein